ADREGARPSAPPDAPGEVVAPRAESARVRLTVRKSAGAQVGEVLFDDVLVRRARDRPSRTAYFALTRLERRAHRRAHASSGTSSSPSSRPSSVSTYPASPRPTRPSSLSSARRVLSTVGDTPSQATWSARKLCWP